MGKKYNEDTNGQKYKDKLKKQGDLRADIKARMQYFKNARRSQQEWLLSKDPLLADAFRLAIELQNVAPEYREFLNDGTIEKF